MQLRNFWYNNEKMERTIVERTNEQWLADLGGDGLARDAALEELRRILIGGLYYGLSGWVRTIGPEFEALAEDFAQEALLRILDNLDSFRGESKFTTWAHKIAVRVGLSELRRKRWQNFSLERMVETEDGDVMTPDFTADPSPTPSLAVEQRDMIRRVHRIILEELTDRQRMAIVATRVRGAPMDIVAEQMGMNRNALYKLLHDARLRLKQRLLLEGLTVEEVLASFEPEEIR